MVVLIQHSYTFHFPPSKGADTSLVTTTGVRKLHLAPSHVEADIPTCEGATVVPSAEAIVAGWQLIYVILAKMVNRAKDGIHP